MDTLASLLGVVALLECNVLVPDRQPRIPEAGRRMVGREGDVLAGAAFFMALLAVCALHLLLARRAA